MLQDFEEHTISARTELELALQLLQTQIRSYPTPIAGCDEQFNFLLSESKKVRAALVALDQSMFVATPRMLTASSRVESR